MFGLNLKTIQHDTFNNTFFFISITAKVSAFFFLNIIILIFYSMTVIISSRKKKTNELDHNFIRPLYLAYSYEEAKGSQHKVLASALKDTSFHLNNTVWRVRREVSYLQNWTLPHEETDILMSLRFYFTNGKRKADNGFKEKTKIEIVTC